MCVSNTNTENIVRLNNVHECKENGGLSLFFSRFKHSQGRLGRHACIGIAMQNNGYCPVKALRNYLDSRKSFQSVYLYCWPSGNPVTRREFAQILRPTLIFIGLDPFFFYKGHGFRMGRLVMRRSDT